MKCLLCQESSKIFFEKQEPALGFKRYQKCPQCHLIFLEPEFYIPREEEHKRYQTHNNSPDDPKYRQFLSQLTDPLLKFLKAGDRGLDFGCGPGPTLALMLREKGMHVSNYDPCFFPDRAVLEEKYDFITCTEVVEHMHNPHQEFEQLDALLKPNNSHLAIMTQLSPKDADFKGWWYHRDPTHVCFYSHQTFEWIARWQQWKLFKASANVVIFSN